LGFLGGLPLNGFASFVHTKGGPSGEDKPTNCRHPTNRQCDPPNPKPLPLTARNLSHCWAMLSPRFAHLLSTGWGHCKPKEGTTGPIRGTASGGLEPFEENHNASLMWQTFLRRLRPGVFASQNQKDLVSGLPNLSSWGGSGGGVCAGLRGGRRQQKYGWIFAETASSKRKTAQISTIL